MIDFIAKLLGYVMNAICWLQGRIGPVNLGLSIILFTVVVYMLLTPLTMKQQKFSKLQGKMAPELQAIQNKYKDKQQDQAAMVKMNEETQAVYKKYGVSPVGSCLPMLLQMPILFALYRVVSNISEYVTIADFSTQNYFFGLNIAESPLNIIKGGLADGSIFLVIGAVLIPVLSFLSQRLSTKIMEQTNSTPKGDNNSANNTVKNMNMMMPVMSAAFCVTLPVGMGIYWIAGAVVRCIQQVVINWWLDRKERNN